MEITIDKHNILLFDSSKSSKSDTTARPGYKPE